MQVNVYSKRPLKDFPVQENTIADRPVAAHLRKPLKDFLETDSINENMLFAISDEEGSFYKKSIGKTSQTGSYLGNYSFFKNFRNSDLTLNQLQLGDTFTTDSGLENVPDPIIENFIGGDGIPYSSITTERAGEERTLLNTSGVSLQLVPEFIIEEEINTSPINLEIFGGIEVISGLSDFVFFLRIQVDKGEGFQTRVESRADLYVGPKVPSVVGEFLQTMAMSNLSISFINEENGAKIIEKGDKIRAVLSFVRVASLLTFNNPPVLWVTGTYEFRTILNGMVFFQRNI